VGGRKKDYTENEKGRAYGKIFETKRRGVDMKRGTPTWGGETGGEKKQS